MPNNIDQQLYAALTGYVADDETIAIAVSGGGDSMALLLAAHYYVQTKNLDVNIIALTVNHNLRVESADEAKQVANWCAGLGIKHKILTWQFDDKPLAAIQEKARDARYQLMGEFCAEFKIKKLFVAHNLEDNAETFLMRLKRGAGLRGLSAIGVTNKRVVAGEAVQITRPFLSIEREVLRGYLRQQGQEWFDDSSNQNEIFERVQIRNFLSESSLLSNQALSQAAVRLKRADQAVEYMVESYWQNDVKLYELGIGYILAETFDEWPDEVKLRILARMVWTIGGLAQPSRWQKIENLLAQLNQENLRSCLGNCLVAKTKGYLWFGYEGRGDEPELLSWLNEGETLQYQGRFLIENGSNETMQICSVKYAPEQIDEIAKMQENLRNCPKQILNNGVLILTKNGKLLSPSLAAEKPLKVNLKTRR